MRLDRPFLATTSVLAAADFTALFVELRERGYRTYAPTVRDGVIRTLPASGADCLPRGIRDRQSPGSYTLEDAGDDELFGYAVGPDSLKTTIFPQRTTLFTTSRSADGTPVMERRTPEPTPTAVIGARPCDAAALETLAHVLVGGAFPDPDARGRRRALFTVLVECGRPAATCFCTSFGTGPGLSHGADIRATELANPHRFLLRPGSAEGAAVLRALPTQPADATDEAARESVLEAARTTITRAVPAESLVPALEKHVDAPEWDAVGERCLACGNCTMVCPTCFCSDIHETSDLAGTARRDRRWASCFELSHSLLSGRPVRSSAGSRYRQWATHKLSTWEAQFGTPGCVGCGRCLAWCPVGIDLSVEALAVGARVTAGKERS